MVKQILSFARGVAGEPVMLQVKHLVDEIVKLAKETFPRSINIATKIGDDLRPIMGDATQLHQVLLNLCVNARDAMPEGGTISIEAENIILEGVKTPMQEQPLSGPHLQLRVSDTGCGIDPAVLDKIFEPFFTTKEDGKGTGLGLSTVLSIVKSHGGMLEVLSQVGRGTTFKICLPVAAATETERARRKPRPPPLGRGELVLLVEDEMAILEITKELLESFNYRVLTATDGVEAVTLYRQRKGEIQLVVTDLMMPIMDGPALIRALRQLDPKAKVIVVSGLGSTAQLADVNDLNVQAYLTKPYSTELLMTTLRNALNGQ
jgi:CheY-like chemotaxis protein